MKRVMELKHKPEPGYRPAFYTAITIALLYLVIIFVRG